MLPWKLLTTLIRKIVATVLNVISRIRSNSFNQKFLINFKCVFSLTYVLLIRLDCLFAYDPIVPCISCPIFSIIRFQTNVFNSFGYHHPKLLYDKKLISNLYFTCINLLLFNLKEYLFHVYDFWTFRIFLFSIHKSFHLDLIFLWDCIFASSYFIVA